MLTSPTLPIKLDYGRRDDSTGVRPDAEARRDTVPGLQDNDIVNLSAFPSVPQSQPGRTKLAGPGLGDARNALFTSLVDKTVGENFERLNSSALPTLQSRS